MSIGLPELAVVATVVAVSAAVQLGLLVVAILLARRLLASRAQTTPAGTSLGERQ
jgi:hypothetical protein